MHTCSPSWAWTGRPAEESTFRRLFAGLDADRLDQILGLWATTRAGTVQDRRVIAVDGKSVRGAREPGGLAPHLVAALDAANGLVLGQGKAHSQGGEIGAARDLLGVLDVSGAVVTMDALHAQHTTAEQVLEQGGDYVLTVKANQPTLFGQLKRLPWKDVAATRRTERSHGRRITRTIKAVDVPGWIEFPGAAQVAQLRRTTTRNGKKTVEVVYLVTSADARAARPQVLAAWVQSHWHIENRLHWVRDVTFGEDACRIRRGAAPRVMASLRGLVIALLRLAGWDNIAAGLRHHASRDHQVIGLLDE
ncbi:ISAs1 family transposase [Nocardiopsis kunsanensis]|uniref:ISAs1 family transposase n=1 Tax=Nocardiopsis kunsanensis TaxID=141693 RepID=A0A919CHM0_9ACTN|nr:ISAs1 family transposase [Nocardiopsis kunsanensis]GHD26386.1 ISAs1 family transposase [Nocardiopsis kunsanensis]